MSSRRHFLLLAALAAVLVVPATSTGQEGGFFTLYGFEEMRFVVHPDGVPRSSGSDLDGSALEIFVLNVSIEDWDAYDLRHCMDGQRDCPLVQCSGDNCFVPWEANQDGTVDPEEVADFERVAASVAVQVIDTLRELTELLQENVTIDGENSDRPRVTRLAFEGAEGDIDSHDTIIADVTVLARYGNDAEADRHEIRLVNLNLEERGFEYEQVLWVIESEDAWVFRADETAPESARSRVSPTGWFSNQAAFESSTADGMTLVVAQDSGSDGGGSPNIGLIAVVLAVIVAALAVGGILLGRRRG